MGQMDEPPKKGQGVSLEERHQWGPSDFVKLKRLGSGAVGQVYLVNLKNTDQLFAMKVLAKEQMIQQHKVHRVQAERDILLKVDHPFVATLYSCFQTKKHLYFVMEYCPGGMLYTLLEKQKTRRFPEEWVRFYAAEVILALQYLHALGFIYRDLKPENILISQSGHLLITDFDLGKVVFASDPQVSQKHGIFAHGAREVKDVEPRVRSNSIVGTLEYLAPEVVAAVGHNASVDWWTLGILMYEMLYGTTPFVANTDGEIFRRIQLDRLSFPDDPAMPVSDTCKSLIKRLLQRDPTRRLGNEFGGTEIKKHPFFKKMDWAMIRSMEPPYVPQLQDCCDTSYYKAAVDVGDLGEDLLESCDLGSDQFAFFTPEMPIKRTCSSTEAIASNRSAHTPSARLTPTSTRSASSSFSSEPSSRSSPVPRLPSTQSDAMAPPTKSQVPTVEITIHADITPTQLVVAEPGLRPPTAAAARISSQSRSGSGSRHGPDESSSSPKESGHGRCKVQ